MRQTTSPPRKNCWHKGAAYKCFCTKEELDAKREAALAAKKPLGYDRTCRNLSADEIAAKEAAGIPSVIRFKVPDRTGTLGYDDKILGRIEVELFRNR